MLRFSGAGVSEVGLVRPHNEDAGYVAPSVCLVADGVGGGPAGEVAAATTARVVVDEVLARPGGPPEAVLRQAVSAARLALREIARVDPERQGLSTTLSVLVTDGERVVLGHVGDSRAYRLRAGRLVQVSRDHTYVQSMIDSSRMTDADATRHPWRNIVLRTVDGAADAVLDDLDVVDLDATAGDRFLLASDGLTDRVSDTRIKQALELLDPQRAVGTLVREALDAGGGDNVTCVVLDVVDAPDGSPEDQLTGQVADRALGALALPHDVGLAAPARTPGG